MKSRNFILFISLLLTSITFSCIDAEEKTYTYEDELADINKYMAALINDGFDFDTTASGVYYIMMEEGEGDYPAQGDSVVVKYNGFFINGSLFDTSLNHNDEGTYSFIYKDQPMIPGFEDGIAILNKGAKIHMVLESGLAYGHDGGGVMQPYTTLIFEVEMIDIIPK